MIKKNRNYQKAIVEQINQFWDQEKRNYLFLHKLQTSLLLFI